MDQAIKFIESFSFPNFERRDVLPIVSIAAATSILFASYRLIQPASKRKGTKEIPTPGSAYPYVGHMLSMGEFPGRKVSEWINELGPIIKLRMGVQTWIMVGDPALAHKIFVSNGSESSYRPHSVYAHDHYSLNGKGVVFSQPDAEWKEARAAMLSVLGPKHIHKYMDTIIQESEDLVSRFIESTEKEGATNPFKHLELNSLNVVFSAAYGRKFDSVDDQEFIQLSTMIEKSMKFAGLENDLANFLPIISIVDYFAGSQVKQKNFIKYERDPVYRNLIKEARASKVPNVVKSLKENGFNLTEDQTLVFTTDLMAAGTDTVSVTLSWMIAIMCNYPEVQKVASAEIDAFVKLHGRLPLFSERTELPYCISVMKECMRFRPTTPFGIPHTTNRDLEVDGYLIPKGATIISNMDSMHKSNVYDEPEKFIPERFIDNLKTMLAAANGRFEERDHYNFGWGRRICPAIYLAEIEIFQAFTQLFSRCIVEPTENAGMPDIVGAENAGLTISPILYKVKFTKRADALISMCSE